MDPTQFNETIAQGQLRMPTPRPGEEGIHNMIGNVRQSQSLLANQSKVIAKEFLILEALLKEQMGAQEYADARKRVEKELFPPPASVDQAEVEDIKLSMASMQKDASDFRNETQGMLRDLSSVTSEMSAFIREMREREPAPVPQREPDDVDRGTTDELEPPDDWQCPECQAVIPTAEIEAHKCSIPPWVCPNCHEEVPNEQKNEHQCQDKATPKKKPAKKK